MRMRQILFAWLAALLLFTQHGAFVHSLTHLADAAPSRSAPQDKHLPHSPACEKCAAYAGVSGALAATPLAFSALAGSYIPAAVPPIPFRSEIPSHYHSRAPPRLA